MSNNYEEGIELLKDENLELAKEKFIKFKKAKTNKILFFSKYMVYNKAIISKGDFV